jgi:thiamine-phosphate pyrophosphorylase
LPWERTLAEAIAGGVDSVQVREKSMEDRSLLGHLKRVIGLARPLGVAVVVNDRTDLALAAHADGVHLGQGDLPIAAARSIAGASLLIGSSAHDLAEAEAAIAAGADLVGLGCMFPSHTKPGLELAGPEFLRSFRERHPAVRHLAIGGIGTENVGLLVEAGGRGVAVSSAILKTRDPRGVAEAIRTAIESGEASPASGEAVSA